MGIFDLFFGWLRKPSEQKSDRVVTAKSGFVEALRHCSEELSRLETVSKDELSDSVHNIKRSDSGLQGASESIITGVNSLSHSISQMKNLSAAAFAGTEERASAVNLLKELDVCRISLSRIIDSLKASAGESDTSALQHYLFELQQKLSEPKTAVDALKKLVDSIG